MTVREIVAWTLSGGGAVGVGASIPLAVRAFNQARMVAALPPTPIAELDPGLHEVSGVLRVASSHTAPMSDRPVVWSRLTLEQQRGNRWETLLDSTSGDVGRIEEGSASVALDLRAADVVVSGQVHLRTGTLQAPGAELDALVARIPGAALSAEPAGPFVRWREEVLLDGDPIHVVATARKAEDGSWELVGEGGPFVVSDRDGSEVVRYLRRTGRRWVLTALASVGVLAWGLWMAAPGLATTPSRVSTDMPQGPPPAEVVGRPPAPGASVPPPPTAGSTPPGQPAPVGPPPAGAEDEAPKAAPEPTGPAGEAAPSGE